MERDRARWASLCALLLSLVACSQAEVATATLLLTPGKETGAWDEAPVVSTLRIDVHTAGGTTTPYDGALPSGAFTLGELDPQAAYAFSVLVRDAAGQPAMRGSTPQLLAGGVSGRELPVLCGRVGAFARPLADLRVGFDPAVAVLSQGRYVLVTGEPIDADRGSFTWFDVGTLEPVVGDGTLSIVPRLVAPVGTSQALVIGDGMAAMLDTVGETVTPFDLAEASSFGEALVVQGESGESYLVAGAGTAASALVLVVAPGKAVERLTLTQLRSKASATWVPGQGLVVGPGVEGAPLEKLDAASRRFVPLTAKVSPRARGAMAALPDGSVVLIGGTAPDGAPAPSEQASLGCKGCDAVKLEGAPAGLAHGASHPAGAASLVVGDDDAGETRAFLVRASAMAATVEPVSLKVRRRGATAVPLGDGLVAVVGGHRVDGGAALDVEVFTPP